MKSDQDYGAMWSQAAQRLDELASQGIAAAAFDAALREGFFSQYTSYDDPDFIGRLLDWQLATLAEWGSPLENEPSRIVESPAIPARLRGTRSGRLVSPDFLRNFAYLAHLRAVVGTGRPPRRIVEIGGGYGAFARLLKLQYPDCCIYLVDIPPSLRFADHFLRASFPQARIMTIEQGQAPDPRILGDACPYDFVLLPADVAVQIAGQQFDLAVNIWSFGEMTDDYLDLWFDLLQRKNRVKLLYTLNAFLHPVEPGIPHLLSVGNWLGRIDADWRALALDADLPIHRCPLIMDYPAGLLLVAERLQAEKEKKRYRSDVTKDFADVKRADWVQLAGDTAETLSGSQVAMVTHYVGIYGTSRLRDGTFAALWNQARVAGDRLAAVLLVIYCRLLSRSNPKSRASREELFYVRGLTGTCLAAEYAHYFDPTRVLSDQEHVRHAGKIFDIQAAYDAAMAKRREEDVAVAAALLWKIVARRPDHAESWFQLGQIAECGGMPARAALHYGLAKELYPGWPIYEESYSRLAGEDQPVEAGAETRLRDDLETAHRLSDEENWSGAETLLARIALVPGQTDRAATFSLLAVIADGQCDILRSRGYAAFARMLSA